MQRGGVHPGGEHGVEQLAREVGGGVRVERPGVREHEADGAGLGEHGGGAFGVGAQHHVDPGDALGSGGVVVQDEQAAVRCHGGGGASQRRATSGQSRATTPSPTTEVAVVATV